MSNYLSQDEIDSLLSGLSAEGGEDDGGGGDGERHKILTPVFELFCKQAESVLGTAVAKAVGLAPEGPCAAADFGAAASKVGTDVLLLTLPFTSGVEGDMYLIIGKKNAAVLADLMMMGDGSAEYSADADDAVSELFNQVMGAFSTAFGADLGSPTSAGNVTVSDFDIANPPFDGASADMGVAKLTVEGLVDSHAVLILPHSFGDEVIELKAPASSGPSMGMGIGISQSEMDELTNMAASSFSSSGSSSSSGGFGASSPSFSAPQPSRTGGYDGPKENIDLLLDVELDINIELGKSELTIKRILELAPGSIVELNRMAGEPVDLIVNNKVVAKGEVVVVDENFGIRIVSLVSAEDRIKSLR